MQAKPSDEELKKLASSVMERLKEIEKHPNWERYETDPCEMFRMEIDGRVASKGIALVNHPIVKILQFLDKEDSLKELNDQLLEIKIIYELKDVLRVNYMQYSGIWPVSNRDFVNVSTKDLSNPSRYYIGTRHCPFPHPEVNGVVRGEVFIGGYVIQKVDEKTSRVTYISDADLKGSIPGMIKNKLSSKQGRIASRVEGAMNKLYA